MIIWIYVIIIFLSVLPGCSYGALGITRIVVVGSLRRGFTTGIPFSVDTWVANFLRSLMVMEWIAWATVSFTRSVSPEAANIYKTQRYFSRWLSCIGTSIKEWQTPLMIKMLLTILWTDSMWILLSTSLTDSLSKSPSVIRECNNSDSVQKVLP